MENLIGISFLLLFFLISFFIYKALRASKWNNCLYLILFLGLSLRVFMASDPYLHTWDERFHALVAKNLIEHPLKPTLYDNPVLPYRVQDWVGNHVWLTKPTLPLWFMAGSMAVFGKQVYALRVPSILISLLCVFLTYWIGKVLFGKKEGLFAAFLHAIHGLSLELSGGIVSSDHVETFLLAFIQLGILSAILYAESAKIKYALLLGMFMGFAFLSKWISGLMILFIFLGFLFHKRRTIKETGIGIIFSGLSFLIIIAPWITYLFIQYPKESQYILSQLFSPIQQGAENHTGSLLYYVDEIRILFGELIYMPLIWLVYRCLNGKKRSKLGFLFYWIIIPLVLLSIADMKRHTYILVAAPAFFLLTAYFVSYLSRIRGQIKLPKLLISLALIFFIALPIRYSLERVKPFKLRSGVSIWETKIENLISSLGTDVSKTILIGEAHYIEAMFHYDLIAYDYIPIPEQIEELKKKGYLVFEETESVYVQR